MSAKFASMKSMLLAILKSFHSSNVGGGGVVMENFQQKKSRRGSKVFLAYLSYTSVEAGGWI